MSHAFLLSGAPVNAEDQLGSQVLMQPELQETFVETVHSVGLDSPRVLLDRSLKSAGINRRSVREFNGIGGLFLIPLSAEERSLLQRQADIEAIELDRVLPFQPPVTTPYSPNSEQLSIQAVTNTLRNYSNSISASGDQISWGTLAVWGGTDISGYGNFAEGSFVFVLDTGLNYETVKSDLNVATQWAKSFVGGSPLVDPNGHGTFVSSQIGALANGIGLVGAAPGAHIVPLKVFPDGGTGAPISAIVDALSYVVDVVRANNLSLDQISVNISLGGSYSSSLDAALRAVADFGIPIALAAGNSGIDVDSTTAAAGDHANIFAISAVDSAYSMAQWSNYDEITTTTTSTTTTSSRKSLFGWSQVTSVETVVEVDDVDLASPGVAISGYAADGSIQYWSGTSMATPFVAALLATVGVDAGPKVALPSSFPSSAADPFALARIFPSPLTPAPDPVFSVTASAATPDEGSQITFLVETNQSNQPLSWEIRATAGDLTVQDFGSLSTLTGTLVLDADGLATVSLDLAADQLTEGLESFSFIIFSNNVQVASVDVSINDTSVAPDASTPPVTDPLTGLVLWGSVGNSVVVGGSGDDSLAGVSETGLDPQYLGRGSVDTLTGGSGSDLFKLGDERGAFYLGSAAKDFAHITDYIAGEDKIQLSRNYDYVWSGQSGSLMLYVDSNGNGLVDGFAFSFFGASAFQSDDLVAQIDGLDAFNLADVVWV